MIGAEAAGNLLAHFHHSNISLCEVVVERHTEIVHESQHLASFFVEAFDQVSSFGLLGSRTATIAQPLAVGIVAIGDQRLISLLELPTGRLAKRVTSLLFG